MAKPQRKLQVLHRVLHASSELQALRGREPRYYTNIVMNSMAIKLFENDITKAKYRLKNL